MPGKNISESYNNSNFKNVKIGNEALFLCYVVLNSRQTTRMKQPFVRLLKLDFMDKLLLLSVVDCRIGHFDLDILSVRKKNPTIGDTFKSRWVVTLCTEPISHYVRVFALLVSVVSTTYRPLSSRRTTANIKLKYRYILLLFEKQINISLVY